MAILTCNRCGKKYSDKALRCPFCIADKPTENETTTLPTETAKKPAPSESHNQDKKQKKTSTAPTNKQLKTTNDNLSSIKTIATVCLILNLIFGCVSLYFLSFLKKENQQYEYTMIAPKDINLTEELNTAGSLGWEVVSSRRAVSDGEGIYEIMMKKTKSVPHR